MRNTSSAGFRNDELRLPTLVHTKVLRPVEKNTYTYIKQIIFFPSPSLSIFFSHAASEFEPNCNFILCNSSRAYAFSTENLCHRSIVCRKCIIRIEYEKFVYIRSRKRDVFANNSEKNTFETKYTHSFVHTHIHIHQEAGCWS